MSLGTGSRSARSFRYNGSTFGQVAYDGPGLCASLRFSRRPLKWPPETPTSRVTSGITLRARTVRPGDERIRGVAYSQMQMTRRDGWVALLNTSDAKSERKVQNATLCELPTRSVWAMPEYHRRAAVQDACGTQYICRTQ